MAVNFNLTKEQAEWLKELLEKRQNEQSWSRTSVDPDDREHTMTVLAKLKSGLGRNSWGGPENR